MYVTIRHYKGVSFPEEAAAKVRDEFLPIISKIQGFQDYYAVRTGNDSVMSISIFTSKPGADESVRAAAQWVQQNLSEYLPNPPEVISGESFAHESVAKSMTAA